MATESVEITHEGLVRSVTALQTEYPFTLPKGYVDKEGTLHRTGVMRLACARDEIEPLRDARVRENEAYATVIVLAKVVTELGSVGRVTTKVIEDLFVGDFEYMQNFYRINFGDPTSLETMEAGVPFLSGARGRGEDHYAMDDLWQEMTYLAYHLHLDFDRLLDLSTPTESGWWRKWWR